MSNEPNTEQHDDPPRMRDHAPDCPAWAGSVCRCREPYTLHLGDGNYAEMRPDLYETDRL